MEHKSMFDEWKQVFERVYETVEEEELRFTQWVENWNKISQHNLNYDLGKVTYRMEMNHFGDLSSAEYKRQMNGYNNAARLQRNGNKLGSTFLQSAFNLTATLPKNVDWREQGYVTPVKDQGQCGSCWSFSTTGALEGQMYRKTGSLVSLSEQNLVDCSTPEGNQGCNGGLMDNAFKYYLGRGKGAVAEEAYPYTARDGSCKSGLTPVVEISKYTDVGAKDEAGLKTAVTQQPVSIAVDARKWQNYRSGVFDGCSSLVQLDHGVLAVGYSSTYWKVKNSWGTSWGESGFIRLTMDKNECGLSNAASWPTV